MAEKILLNSVLDTWFNHSGKIKIIVYQRLYKFVIEVEIDNNL